MLSLPTSWSGWMRADHFVLALIVQYVLAALAYAWERSWWRALYFLSATGISVAVLKMR